MRLRPVYNSKLGRWSICHDQWCKSGETSIVATIASSLNEQVDGELARRICERFNAAEAKEATT